MKEKLFYEVKEMAVCFILCNLNCRLALMEDAGMKDSDIGLGYVNGNSTTANFD